MWAEAGLMARGPPLKKQPGLEIVLKHRAIGGRELKGERRWECRWEREREEKREHRRRRGHWKDRWRVAGTDTRDQRPHPTPGCGWHFCSEAPTDTFHPALRRAKELSHLPWLLHSPLFRANEQCALDSSCHLPVNITTRQNEVTSSEPKSPLDFFKHRRKY